MKKLLFAFALLCFMQGNAQTGQSSVADRKVGRLEGEIGVGPVSYTHLRAHET